MHSLAGGRSRRARPGAAACLGLAVLACAPAPPVRATLGPAALREAEEARRLAVAGDLDAARAKWEGILGREAPAHAVRVASPCAGLREALVARRDLAPLFVRTLADGCFEVLWGHFPSESAAEAAAGRVPARLLDGPGDVVALTAPLSAPASSAGAARPEPPPPVIARPEPARAESRPEPVPAVVDVPPAVPAPEPTRPPEVARSEPRPPQGPDVSPPAPIAEEPARPSPSLEGETPASLFQKGNVAYADGDLDGAIAAFEGALALEPDNPRALNNLGATWLLKGDAARAASLARKALDLDPGYARASLNLGTAIFALDKARADEARPYLERAVELDPANVDARNNLAALLVEQRKWSEAERVLLDALQVAPADPRLVRQLEQVQGQLGVRTAVPAPATRVAPPPVRPSGVATEPVAPAPGGPCSKPLSAAARTRLASQLFADGREAYGRGDMEAAEAILERALECEPESPAVLNHLGAARLQAGKAMPAVTAFELALQFQPDFPEASVNLALALLAQGRCDDSTSRLGGLRAQHPDSGEAAYQHARALLRCGRASEALSAIEAAERLLPQDQRVGKLRARLEGQQLPGP